MSQPSLFDQADKVTVPGGAQRLHLARVTATIGTAVLDFCRQRVGLRFHAQDLRDFVLARGFTAPASPDRILRALRQKGVLCYEVKNRAASLYCVTWVKAR